jgi:hypothetical protein
MASGNYARSSSVSDFDWEPPPLTSDDERLIAEYTKMGKSVDDLPYTEEFKKLVVQLGLPDTDANKHQVFWRLLRLRKMGRLPRVGDVISSSSVVSSSSSSSGRSSRSLSGKGKNPSSVARSASRSGKGK